MDGERIKLENRGGSRIDPIRRDHVVREGRPIEIEDWVKARKISIPHGLVGYGLLADRLSPVPHAFVVGKEEGAVLK